MTNEKGQSTSALYGFIRSVQKLIKEFSPTHLICVFDGPDNKKSRQAIFADYKAHRLGAPEDLFPQFELASTYCDLAGIPVLCLEGVEADDTMASIAHWAKKQGVKTYLCTSDKDLLQLVDPNTFVLLPHKDYLQIDARGVKQLYNVEPHQMLDYLAMVGDASDNIPGIEGFGQKTAAALLEEFGSLDNLLAHPERVKGERKQEILRTQKEQALMSRALATLHVHMEIPHIEDFYRLKAPAQENLAAFYHQMHFNSLLREMGTVTAVHKTKGKKKTSAAVPLQYHLIHTQKQLEDLLHHIPVRCIFSVQKKKSVSTQKQLMRIPILQSSLGSVFVPLRALLGISLAMLRSSTQ